jgi:hypothetical protein
MSNILLNKPATASDYYAPFTPAKAVDGVISPLSRWVSSKVPASLAVDSGSMYLANRWVVRNMSVAGWVAPDYANCDFTFQGSTDNCNWVNIDSVTNNSASIVDRTLPVPVAFRYFRVSVSKGLRCNTQVASIVEFELYQAYSAQLSALTVNAGTLTPSFLSTVYAYTDTVGPDVTSIQVTPTTVDPQAAIKINGIVSTSGQPKSVDLAVGPNTITINVTASDSSQSTYTLTVTRQGNADLKSLVAEDNLAANVPLNPAFDKGIIAYTAKIDYDASAIAYTPTTEDPQATIKLDGTSTPNGSISGATVVGTGVTNVLEVTSTSGTKKSYSVAVSKHTSAYLTGIGLKQGKTNYNLSPTFVKTTYSGYSVSISGTPVVVTPTKEDPAATLYVTCNGVEVTGSGSYSVTTISGANTVVIRVTSTTGDVKTYTFVITK